MQNFLDVRCSTYSNLTLEFFSTISVEVIQCQKCQNGRITFQLLGRRHTLTLDEFNNIYVLPTSLDIVHRRIPPSFDKFLLWSQNAGGTSYNLTSSKVTNITNPVFCYAYRILSTGIFVRGDNINVVRNQ